MRPDVDRYFMRIAYDVSARGACARRRVGCVLVDDHSRVLSTGYNGRVRGLANCGEGGFVCEGSDCDAVHAEANAVAQCRDPMATRTAYVTVLPCERCAKLLLATGCRRFVYSELHDESARVLRLLRDCGAEALHATQS